MAELQNVSGIFDGRRSLPAANNVSTSLTYLPSGFWVLSSCTTIQDPWLQSLLNLINQSPVQNCIIYWTRHPLVQFSSDLPLYEMIRLIHNGLSVSTGQ